MEPQLTHLSNLLHNHQYRFIQEQNQFNIGTNLAGFVVVVILIYVLMQRYYIKQSRMNQDK
jgi:hypothetical protein